MKDNPFSYIHNLAINSFNGVSAKICLHFWQMYKSGHFQAFDYGPDKNEELYGTPTPFDVMEHFDKVDIPFHFTAGKKDALIHWEDVQHQHEMLHEVHPELTTFKAFQDLGHVQFTLGANEEIIEHFSQILAQSRRPDRREKRS